MPTPRSPLPSWSKIETQTNNVRACRFAANDRHAYAAASAGGRLGTWGAEAVMVTWIT